MKRSLLTIAYLFFFTLFLFYPDTFRVSTIHTCVFDTEVFEPATFSLGYNDALSCQVKSDFLFLEGIEFEIKQNKTGMNFPHSIAYSVYTGISPEPAPQTIDYSARKLITALVPNRFSHTIRIPVKHDYTFKRIQNGDLLAYERGQGSVPLMLRFNPVMKGLSEEFEAVAFTVIIKPLLMAEGGLQIKLHYPENEQKPVTVQLNNEALPQFNTMHMLPPGTYIVNVNSDDYRHEVRSCIIERGKITQLDIQLKSIVPLLHIQAPENVTVFLDNQELLPSRHPIPVQVGTHVVLFKIGSYELTRQITVESGKTYHLTMMMDVVFQEIGE